ncbi:hypothetical protein R3P38DRAFT_1614820 [Favolaschia claudopus]|uniref:Uncharacterized protein n=1 Tax=Favolaschia claudopus TaxID=2862362 RepID=A0AAW0AHC0_9AGAR
MLVKTIYAGDDQPYEDIQGLARGAFEACIGVLRESAKSQAKPPVKVLWPPRTYACTCAHSSPTSKEAPGQREPACRRIGFSNELYTIQRRTPITACSFWACDCSTQLMRLTTKVASTSNFLTNADAESGFIFSKANEVLKRLLD